ncbi:sensor histidine kinase [Allosphingosinicella sp.]|jgi:two-component sensor histidine kinase|uniref:sensor histidine kinase n=1 Tax=Allosphingosinicella sp. TaxID=2823234 RepID=UPI002EFB9632
MVTSPKAQERSEDRGAGTLIRDVDWSATPFGLIETWPAPLRFAAQLCERASVATAVYWGDEFRIIYNLSFAPVLRERHPEALGRPAAEVWPDLWHVLRPSFEQVVATGRGVSVYEQMLPMQRGEVVEETYWNYTLTPILGEDGTVAGILNQGLEITRALLAERRLSFQVALADRLRGISDPEEVKSVATRLLGEHLGASRVGYAEIDEAFGTVAVRKDWTRDPETQSLGGHSGLIKSFGEEALAFLRSGETLAIPDVAALGLPADRAAAWEAVAMRALITVPLVRDGELKALLYVHEPKPRFWKRSEAAIARDAAERTWAAVERAVAEQRQRLLINELNHRVKNTLATVQAIAFQTLKGDIGLAEARTRFEARLMALSRAHGMLTAQNWEGASLRRVVDDATEYLGGSQGRFAISGDEVSLAPRAALALALAFHELSTNAAKYGALSIEGGTVEVSWLVEGGILRLEWRERGGPAVVAPERRGFGSRLIERGLAADLGGTARLEFDPDGLVCSIEAALDILSPKP